MTDSDEVKLLPCDWCGKVPSIVCPDNSYGSAFITCGDANECPVDVTAWAELPHETLEDAKRRWNTRARPPVVTDEVVERVAPIVARALAKRAGLGNHRPCDAWMNEAKVATRTALEALASMPAVVSGGQSEREALVAETLIALNNRAFAAEVALEASHHAELVEALRDAVRHLRSLASNEERAAYKRGHAVLAKIGGDQ